MRADEPIHLYLVESAIRALAELLEGIPSLAEDLQDAVTGQARLGAANTRIASRSNDQPLPFSVSAADVRDHLHATLVGWVRLVCEQRGLEYNGRTGTGDLARWLRAKVIALAMTEGVESAPADIGAAVTAAERIVCPPSQQLTVDAGAVESARRARLNASGIAVLAKELGEPFRSVTVRRIQTLRDAGRIAPVPGPWSIDWPDLYVVGDVFDAHLAFPSRRRKSAAAPGTQHSRLLVVGHLGT